MNDFYAIIDRDGTIIEEPEDFQIDSFEKFRFKDGAIEALIELNKAGYKLILATNQDGLGSEIYPRKWFDYSQKFMLETLASCGITFEYLGICEHMPEDNCQCRKPNVGLLPPAIQAGHFDHSRTFVVGDRQSDIELARNLNVKGFNCDEISWPNIVSKMLEWKRESKVIRKTSETQIEVTLLEGNNERSIETGLGFFDHMLDAFSRFCAMGVQIRAKGDLHIDDHHLIEDVAPTLGQAFDQALSDRRGIQRYSQWTPMDEAHTKISMDLSGRPSCEVHGQFTRGEVGGVSTEMLIHFAQSLSQSLKAAFYIEISGDNTHHQAESLFKGLGLCVGQAIQRKREGIPSTKGVL